MLQPRISSSLRRTLLNSASPSRTPHPAFHAYRATHLRPFTSATHLRRPSPQPSQKPQPTTTSSTPKDGTAKEEENFVPKPLGRPIGFPMPPQAGQNTGAERTLPKEYKNMTLSERNIAKRMDLVEKWGTNYFRDFKNIRKYRSGKTFMSNPRIFKKEAALYFPNFRGITLEGKTQDTTNVLQGKVSVVNVYSSEWGAAQVQTFTGKNENPALRALLDSTQGLTQVVDVNIEENPLKAWIIGMFRYSLRSKRTREEWGKYFVVRKGVTDKIREAIGLLNGRVGYVYLLDKDCKIRWAGSAYAEGTEMEDLNRGLVRLVEENGGKVKTKVEVQTESVDGKEKEKGSKEEKPLPIPVPVAFK
ncbi:hypothetical protein DM02DRAFT_615515 [Periconia macrospinosa]|uniref:F1F0 ATP synthase assembly protein Atp10 n=1 Tax=Periconia macrospinosa TaxID=97972 RepID=A0A2V1DM87_9PLEO|nr:hypothetical protein DM02DRAFT_615515 [Periconia macrospinosa]